MERTTEVKQSERVTATRVSSDKPQEMVVAKVPTGYKTNINVRLVAGRNLDIAKLLQGCRSRTGASRRDMEPLELPAELIVKLKEADKKIIAWLAQDETNAQLFFASPAEALGKAGVELTRAELKAIDRTHSQVKEATVVAPGVEVAELKVAAYTRAKVGSVKPGTRPEDITRTKVGCAKEE